MGGLWKLSVFSLNEVENFVIRSRISYLCLYRRRSLTKIYTFELSRLIFRGCWCEMSSKAFYIKLFIFVSGVIWHEPWFCRFLFFVNVKKMYHIHFWPSLAVGRFFLHFEISKLIPKNFEHTIVFTKKKSEHFINDKPRAWKKLTKNQFTVSSVRFALANIRRETANVCACSIQIIMRSQRTQ